MERWRGVSYGPINRKNNSNINPQYSQVKKTNRINFSIGKSATNIRTYEKILNIKRKCLQEHQQQKNDKSNGQISLSPGKKISLYDQDFDADLDLITMNQQQTQVDNAELEKQEYKGSYLIKSRIKGRPPVVYFRYPKCCEIQEKQQSNSLNKIQIAKRIVKVPQFNLKYKIYGSHYRCIMNAFEYNGFEEGKNSNWDVYFDVRGSKVNKIYHIINQNQKFNHFAGCWHIGRKDELYYHIEKQRKLFNSEYNFLPRTYIFPNDYDRFETARELSQQSQLWIQKPVASACGRNIKVISNDSVIRKKRNVLISEYISNPHLINNYKYDLRIYVLVTSYNPLRIYLYDNGLVRFATQQFTLKSLSKKFVHLTNFSVNKNSKNFVKNKSANQNDQNASKWSLHRLRQYYEKQGISSDQIFQQIQDIIIKTCIAVEGSMVAPKYRHEDKRTAGFQIYGFDILIDDKLKAWLLEVNVCPSLCSSSPFDKKIKHTLLVDILNLIGVKPPIQKKDNISPKKQPNSKRFKFKNVHSIVDLGYQNCLQMLQPEDWLIIFESQQQFDRLGHFSRIFPKKDNICKYQIFFECLRYNNHILWKHLLSKKGFLSRLNI